MHQLPAGLSQGVTVPGQNQVTGHTVIIRASGKGLPEPQIDVCGRSNSNNLIGDIVDIGGITLKLLAFFLKQTGLLYLIEFPPSK